MKIKDYQEELKKKFDEEGSMSNTYLMRKYKINFRQAHLLMKPFAPSCFFVRKHNGIISKIVRDAFY